MANETPTTKRCRRAALKIGMTSAPFILPALAQVTFHESTAIETMDITIKGVIRVNPEFVKLQSEGVLGGCVANLLLHLLMLHTQRRGGREQPIWDVASDMSINQILREGRIPLPAHALYPPSGHEKSTTEGIYDAIYEALEQQARGIGQGQDEGQEQTGSQPKVCAGCGVGQAGEGDEEGQAGGKQGEGQGEPDTAPGDADSASRDIRKWRECAVQALAMGQGTQAGKALARALTPPPPRVKYHQVLRSSASRALSAHGRDDQTWTRISRRSPAEILLPGWCATKARGGVVIDSSGSVTDQQLAQAASETASIQRACPGLKLYLVVHDHAVHFSGWVDAKTPEVVQRRIVGRGGTRFDEAYQEIETKAGRLDFCVHLTDCEIWGWPPLPRNVRRFIVAKLGNGQCHAPEGALEILVDL